jgi:hypothetical protein
MIAIVTAVVAASVVTIFTAVELDRLNSKQQKADTVAKLGLMALKEIFNSQLELIRLTKEVVSALDAWWADIDTIQHVLLVCDVAERQVGVMESVMQAAMGGHLSVTAFTELNYARVALKIGRDARDAGLEPVARHLSDYLQMETSFVAGKEGFSTLVHVPLIDMKSALTIWEHHILPIPQPVLELRTSRLHPFSSHGRPDTVQGNVEGRVQHLPPRGGMLPLRSRTRLDKGAETERHHGKTQHYACSRSSQGDSSWRGQHAERLSEERRPP